MDNDVDWSLIPQKIAELINATIEAQKSELCRLPDEPNKRSPYDEADTIYNAVSSVEV